MNLPGPNQLHRRLRQWVRWAGVPPCKSKPASRLPTAPVAPYPKLFVVGAPRSGTSWIQNILAQHPRVVATRESHLCPRILKPLCEEDCGRRVTWDQLLHDFDRQASANPIIGIHRYVTRPVFENLLEAARRRVTDNPSLSGQRVASHLIRQILDAFFVANHGSPADLLVEKTPTHVLHGEFLLKTFPEARLLHVLRDGRDVCVSLEMRSGAAGWSLGERSSQIRLWKRCVEEGRRLLESPSFHGRVAEVRYEDVKRDPVGQIERLSSFAGLSGSPGFARRAARRTDFRNYRVSGPGKHNRKGVVGDWRNHFASQDEALFEQLAGELLRRVGY